MPLRNVWLVERNGTRPASNVVCVTNSLIPQTVPSTREKFFARTVMPESLDPKVTDSAAELAVCLWMLVSTLETLKEQAISPSILTTSKYWASNYQKKKKPNTNTNHVQTSAHTSLVYLLPFRLRLLLLEKLNQWKDVMHLEIGNFYSFLFYSEMIFFKTEKKISKCWVLIMCLLLLNLIITILLSSLKTWSYKYETAYYITCKIVRSWGFVKFVKIYLLTYILHIMYQLMFSLMFSFIFKQRIE